LHLGERELRDRFRRSPYNPDTVGEADLEPRVLARREHTVSRSDIDPNAQKVLYRLERAGYETYLVGGGVRDLLLGREPKDYDVATAARPEEIRRLFRNSRIIGRRFRLAHVYFRGGIVEVSTFRGAPDRGLQRGGPDDLLVTDDNVFGTPREDAFRRDFTINALYYRISDFTIVDHVGGFEDLERQLIRVIGDPELRFREDPVRMLRACEMAARLGFRIEESAQQAILDHRREMKKAAPPRVREELMQILRCGSAAGALQWMLDLGLLELLMPEFLAMTELTMEGVASFDRILGVVDSSNPKRLDYVVILGVVLAPLLFQRGRDAELEESGSLNRSRVRALAELSVRDFFDRLEIPNALAEHILRALTLLLRLQDLPDDRWERVRISREPAFGNALQIFNLLVKATGEGQETVAAWRTALRDKNDIPASAKKPRRRRRRPRKPAGGR